MLISEHAARRMTQRGISMADVGVALDYGVCESSHRALRFTLTDRVLAATPYQKKIDRLRGLCIVLADETLVTAKWVSKLRHHGGARKHQGAGVRSRDAMRERDNRPTWDMAWGDMSPATA